MSFEELNLKQQLFVEEYISCLGNAVQAYLKVYSNVKYNTARANASRLLSNANIVQAINDEYKKIWPEKDSEVEKSKTYQMIHALGNSDISDVVDLAKGTLRVKDLKDIPPAARQAIQSIKYDRRMTKEGMNESLEVRMHPKLAALELRAKIQRMIDSKVELPVDIVIKPAVRPGINDNKESKKMKINNNIKEA